VNKAARTRYKVMSGKVNGNDVLMHATKV